MGKPSKRKNPGVGVDFRKVKHKVGKKLPKAQNDTNTDFKSRSINLSTQSIAQDKAGAAVSERNLTLKVRALVKQQAKHTRYCNRGVYSSRACAAVAEHPTLWRRQQQQP
jgi:pre-rRNA-processing protein IPI1